jgi:hypothetical protein
MWQCLEIQIQAAIDGQDLVVQQLDKRLADADQLEDEEDAEEDAEER